MGTRHPGRAVRERDVSAKGRAVDAGQRNPSGRRTDLEDDQYEAHHRSGDVHATVASYLEAMVTARQPHLAAVLLPNALPACPAESAITLPLAECHGPWLNSPQYWRRMSKRVAPQHLRDSVSDTLLHCRLVWWALFYGSIRDVPPGTYACVFRLKTERERFEAEFKVGPQDFVQINMETPYQPDKAIPELRSDCAFFTTRCENGPAVMRDIQTRNGWSQLVIGVIEVRQQCDIHCAVGGNNAYGTGGLWFDCLQLVPLSSPWAVTRLLWLASKKPQASDCGLAALDEHTLRRIQQILQRRVIIEDGTWRVGVKQ